MAKLIDIATRIQNSNLIKDRRWRLRKFKKCLVGNELVTWFISNDIVSSRQEAVKLGNKLVYTGILNHVKREHMFKDAYLFYRLSLSEMKATGVKYVSYLENLIERKHIEKERIRLELKETERQLSNQWLTSAILLSVICFLTLPTNIVYVLACTVLLWYLFYYDASGSENVVVEKTAASTQLRKLYERIGTKSISEEELEVECGVLRSTYAFITSRFISTCWETYQDLTECIEITKNNLQLYTNAEWTKITTERLRACLETEFQLLLPGNDPADETIFFVNMKKLRFAEFPCTIFQQCSFLLMQKPESSGVAIVDWEGLSISEFRKITKREISIGQFFVGCSPVKINMIYFINVPWWIRIVKALIPKKHLRKVRTVTKREVVDIFGAERIPRALGGSLNLSIEWKQRLDKWHEEEVAMSQRRNSFRKESLSTLAG